MEGSPQLLERLAAHERVAARLEVALRPLQVTLRQVQVLALARQEPRHQRALALALGRADSNLTALVDGLEETGLVRRQANPDDRRQWLVAITEAGAERLRQAEDIVDGLARDLLEALRGEA